MESDEVAFKAYSLMESSLFSFQCLWSTKKKRSLKLVKSKEFSSSSSSRKEEGGVRRLRPVIYRVYSRKRKRLSRVGNERRACDNKLQGSDGVEAASHEKLPQHSDDDGIVLGDWIRERRRISVKSGEDESKEPEMKTESVMKVELFEDHGCTVLPSWGSGRFTSKRKNRRRKVELEVKSDETKSVSVTKVEPSEDHGCILLASRSSGRSTGGKRDRRQVELEEDVAWEEEVQMISKIKATKRRRRGSHSPEHVTCVSGSRSCSPASEVSHSLLHNGCSDDPESMKNTSKVTSL